MLTATMNVKCVSMIETYISLSIDIKNGGNSLLEEDAFVKFRMVRNISADINSWR